MPFIGKPAQETTEGGPRGGGKGRSQCGLLSSHGLHTFVSPRLSLDHAAPPRTHPISTSCVIHYRACLRGIPSLLGYPGSVDPSFVARWQRHVWLPWSHVLCGHVKTRTISRMLIEGVEARRILQLILRLSLGKRLTLYCLVPVRYFVADTNCILKC